MKQDFVYKLISFVDDKIVNDLLLTLIEEDWFIDDYRQVAPTMSKTNSIPIFHTPQCAFDTGIGAFKTVQKNKLYDRYFEKIKPILNLLKNYYQYNYYTAFLSRLHPKSQIGEHSDIGLFLENCYRIHLPILTNKEVYYNIQGYDFNWLKGCLYEFDNTLVHGVINNSDQYRIHLVINLYNLPSELLSQLQQDDFLLELNNEAFNSTI